MYLGSVLAHRLEIEADLELSQKASGELGVERQDLGQILQSACKNQLTVEKSVSGERSGEHLEVEGEP